MQLMLPGRWHHLNSCIIIWNGMQVVQFFGAVIDQNHLLLVTGMAQLCTASILLLCLALEAVIARLSLGSGQARICLCGIVIVLQVQFHLAKMGLPLQEV